VKHQRNPTRLHGYDIPKDKWKLFAALCDMRALTITAQDKQQGKCLSMFNYRFLRQQVQKAVFIEILLQTVMKSKPVCVQQQMYRIQG
jgi:hypothetical protein